MKIDSGVNADALGKLLMQFKNNRAIEWAKAL